MKKVYRPRFHPALSIAGRFVLAAVQWRNSAIQTSAGCPTTVGDMFNNSLKSKLDAVCTELAAYVADTPSTDQEGGREEVSYHSARQHSDWWPINLGTPSAVGAQNALQYAIVPGTRRLAIRDGEQIEIYDTGKTSNLRRGPSAKRRPNSDIHQPRRFGAGQRSAEG